MPAIGVSVRVSGPFFGGAAPDVIRDALSKSIGDVVALGETSVKLQLYPGHGLRSGHYRRSIHGEMQNSMFGRIHDSNVIYGPWLEGVGSRNQTTRFKGYHMFRQAKGELERKIPGIVNRRVAQAVGRLN